MSNDAIPLADMVGCQVKDCDRPANATFDETIEGGFALERRSYCYHHVGVMVMGAHEAVVRQIPGQSMAQTMVAENDVVLWQGLGTEKRPHPSRSSGGAHVTGV